MASSKIIAGTVLLLLALNLALPGCVWEPREGYYDRGHQRWYHAHEWRNCGDRDGDEHCR